MEQQSRKHLVTVEVDSDVKRWLDRQSAQRLIDGRAYGERSVGAVIRDLIDVARSDPERESAQEIAMAS